MSREPLEQDLSPGLPATTPCPAAPGRLRGWTWASKLSATATAVRHRRCARRRAGHYPRWQRNRSWSPD